MKKKQDLRSFTFPAHDETKDGAPWTVVEHVPLPDEGLSQPVGGVEHDHPTEAQLHAVEGAILVRQPVLGRSEGRGS